MTSQKGVNMTWLIVGVAWGFCSWVLILALCKAAARGDMPTPPQDDRPGVVVALDAYREKETMR